MAIGSFPRLGSCRAGSFCSQHRERSGPSAFSCRSNVSSQASLGLTFERQEKDDGPDLSRCWLQKEPGEVRTVGLLLPLECKLRGVLGGWRISDRDCGETPGAGARQ